MARNATACVLSCRRWSASEHGRGHRNGLPPAVVPAVPAGVPEAEVAVAVEAEVAVEVEVEVVAVAIASSRRA